MNFTLKLTPKSCRTLLCSVGVFILLVSLCGYVALYTYGVMHRFDFPGLITFIHPPADLPLLLFIGGALLTLCLAGIAIKCLINPWIRQQCHQAWLDCLLASNKLKAVDKLKLHYEALLEMSDKTAPNYGFFIPIVKALWRLSKQEGNSQKKDAINLLKHAETRGHLYSALLHEAAQESKGPTPLWAVFILEDCDDYRFFKGEAKFSSYSDYHRNRNRYNFDRAVPKLIPHILDKTFFEQHDAVRKTGFFLVNLLQLVLKSDDEASARYPVVVLFHALVKQLKQIGKTKLAGGLFRQFIELANSNKLLANSKKLKGFLYHAFLREVAQEGKVNEASVAFWRLFIERGPYCLFEDDLDFGLDDTLCRRNQFYFDRVVLKLIPQILDKAFFEQSQSDEVVSSAGSFLANLLQLILTKDNEERLKKSVGVLFRVLVKQLKKVEKVDMLDAIIEDSILQLEYFKEKGTLSISTLTECLGRYKNSIVQPITRITDREHDGMHVFTDDESHESHEEDEIASLTSSLF